MTVVKRVRVAVKERQKDTLTQRKCRTLESRNKNHLSTKFSSYKNENLLYRSFLYWFFQTDLVAVEEYKDKPMKKLIIIEVVSFESYSG